MQDRLIDTISSNTIEDIQAYIYEYLNNDSSNVYDTLKLIDSIRDRVEQCSKNIHALNER